MSGKKGAAPPAPLLYQDMKIRPVSETSTEASNNGMALDAQFIIGVAILDFAIEILGNVMLIASADTNTAQI